MLVLNADDMSRVMTMPEAVDAAAEALKLQAAGSCDIPLRGKVDTPAPNKGTTLFMYGAVSDARALGVKLYAEFPGNRAQGLPVASATVVLLDAATGYPEALLDGTYLTQLRTGASSAVATDALARSDARTMLLVGAGHQAWSQVEAALAVRPLEKIMVCDRSEEAARAFATRERERLEELARTGVLHAPVPEFVVASSADSALVEADIVSCVTTSTEPVFSARAVRPGTHVNAVGSYTPEMSELPGELVAQADLVYLDVEAALEESGDLIKPEQAGLWDKTNLQGLVGDLLLGKAVGRSSAEQITVYEAVGFAALDLVVGQRMVQRAQELGMGQVVRL